MVSLRHRERGDLFRGFALLRFVSILLLSTLDAFSLRPLVVRSSVSRHHFHTCSTLFAATADGEKKKRRRKKPPAVPIQDPVKVSQEVVEGLVEDETQQFSEADLSTMNDIARFEFQNDKAMSMSILTEDFDIAATDDSAPVVSGAIPLPDIREARKRKQLEEELAREAQEKEEQKVKIKRTDKEAFRRLLEQQPFADADDSYFEEEKYGAVSALLGERAKPFLSIPFGPLQVGHFIGSLVIVLMAYVEYPGFPLTNLPTPLRECFQGGLGTVYAINTLLAVAVALKLAPDRGQPVLLWVMKTFFVGGLALDQLMQLPTLEETEKANAVKGARAIKKNSSR